ncbi:unnamed protein product, partial [Clonostachys chloroleuca]
GKSTKYYLRLLRHWAKTINPAITFLNTLITVIQLLNLSIGELYDFFQTCPSVQDKANAAEVEIVHGAISFNGTRHSRDSEIYLENSSFNIPPRKITYFIGKNGAGKTTILNLIFRPYKFDGSITIDDQKITEVTKDSLQAQISILPQESSLFEGTIRENLLPGRIENVCRTACTVDAIYSFIRPKCFPVAASEDRMQGLWKTKKRFCKPVFNLICSLERNHERVARKKRQDEDLMKACKNACIWDVIQGFTKGLDT